MYLVSVKMACKILRLSDVKGLAKTYLNAWKSGKVCCFHENRFPTLGEKTDLTPDKGCPNVVQI